MCKIGLFLHRRRKKTLRWSSQDLYRTSHHQSKFAQHHTLSDLPAGIHGPLTKTKSLKELHIYQKHGYNEEKVIAKKTRNEKLERSISLKVAHKKLSMRMENDFLVQNLTR